MGNIKLDMPSSSARKRTAQVKRANTEPEIDWRDLVRVLVERRENQGMTQAEVARRMKTSQPYVARLEKAETDLRVSTLTRYAMVVAGGLLVLAEILRELSRENARVTR